LQCRVCLRTYRLFFSAHTEDVIVREGGAVSVAEEVKVRKAGRFEAWVERRVKGVEGKKEEEEKAGEKAGEKEGDVVMA